MREYVPEHMQAAVASFENALADAHTTRIRGEKMEIPEDTPEEQKENAEALAEAAARSDAPKELKALGQAVEEGRTTWDDVLTGQAHRVPEYQSLVAASMPMVLAAMEEAEREEQDRAEQDRATDRDGRRG